MSISRFLSGRYTVSHSIFISIGSILCGGQYIPLHSARSIEELRSTCFKEKPGRIPLPKRGQIRRAEIAWNEYMETYGDLEMVRNVINTLDEAPESGDATEGGIKQSDVCET